MKRFLACQSVILIIKLLCYVQDLFTLIRLSLSSDLIYLGSFGLNSGKIYLRLTQPRFMTKQLGGDSV